MTAVEESTVARGADSVRGAAWLASLGGRRVAVVGLARSGVAAARLLREAGAEVVGVDAQPLTARSARRPCSTAPSWSS